MTKPDLAVLWSPEAEADLIEIWRNGAEGYSAGDADRRIQDIVAAGARLAGWPNAGRARTEIATGLRAVSVPPHVLFYRVTSTAIQIVRVLHGRRDIDAIFGDFGDGGS